MYKKEVSIGGLKNTGGIRMAKKVPVLASRIVQMVLKGNKNEEIIKALNLEGEKNEVNFNINEPRRWFEAHKREKEYAMELLSFFPAEEIQRRFEHFCSMSVSMQKISKDLLLEEMKQKVEKKRNVRQPVYA